MKYSLHGQETERLRFRTLQASDFEDWLKLFHEKHVAKFLGLDPNLSPRELCQLWFDKILTRYEKNMGGMEVLVHKDTNRLVGQSGLLVQNIEDLNRLEVAYSILPEFRHQGFASEAAQKCKDYAFENNFSKSLISIIHVENLDSEKVALKNGMRIEKMLPNHRGNPVNIFCIHKADWMKS